MGSAVEDTLFSMAWPREMAVVPLSRMVSAELTIRGTTPASQIGDVRDAFVALMAEAGFQVYREFPQRTGSTILPFIFVTSEPTTQEDAQGKARELVSALREEAEVKKFKSETLRNYAGAFVLLITSLGLVVNLTLRPPQKFSLSVESGVTIEWSSPVTPEPKPKPALRLKGTKPNPVEKRRDDAAARSPQTPVRKKEDRPPFPRRVPV